MVERAERRRILCIRPRPNPDAAEFLAAMRDEWIPALALHCDVKTIEEDFDLDHVCDIVKPHLIIIEMVSWTRPTLPVIANAGAHPAIPRAAILNGDPHEPMLPALFHVLGHYGIDTLFGFGLHHHQHIPELSDVDCYALPIFVDGTVFRDYGLPKIIPVSVFGGHMGPSFYPWRAKVVAEIQHIFPTLVYPHPGYRSDQGTAFTVQGADYARLLNQSHFSVGDSTRLDYVVRKHLEIPGAGSILLAPNSPALKDYGFVDMANCIMGSPSEVYGKIDAVSRDEALYAAIRQNGFDLVHANYTRECWTSILDWLDCRLGCGAGEVVRQRGAMGPFRVAGAVPSRPAIAGTLRDSPLSAVLRQARDAILVGRDLTPVHASLVEVSAWASKIAEPVFLMGIIRLLRAEPVDAAMAIARRAEDLRGLDPGLERFDPCEVAWLLLIAHLIGHEPLIEAMQQQARETRHLAVRRVLWLLGSDEPEARDLARRRAGDHLSIHWLGQEDFASWRGLVGRVLDVNGADAVKATLRRRLQAHGDHEGVGLRSA